MNRQGVLAGVALAATLWLAACPTTIHAQILTSDLQLWLKADSVQGVADGEGIGTWYDSSLYGRNATVYNGAPILITNGLNGNPIVKFTGTQSFAVADSPVWMLGNYYTVFLVARRDAAWRGDDWWSGIMMGQDNGSGQQGKWAISFGPGTSRGSFSIGGSGVANRGFSVDLPYTQYGLFESHVDGSLFEGYFNGSLCGSDTNVPAATPTDLARPLTIGYWETIYDGPYYTRPLADSGFHGGIAELLIYNTAVSDAQRISVEQYLIGKYGLPVIAAQITAQPQSRTCPLDGQTTFQVTATGTEPLHYQWYFNGAAIAGAESSNLTLSNLAPGAAGVYSVTVWNSAGTNTSASASLGLNTLKLYAGLNAYGPVGSNYLVQFTTNLTEPVLWTPLRTVAIVTNPAVFIDYDSPDQPRRFYRMVPQ